MGPSNDTLIVKLTKQRPRNECLLSYLHIIDSQYIVVQYNTILHTVNTINLKRNFGQTKNSWKTTKHCPNGRAMGAFCELFGENRPGYTGSAQYLVRWLLSRLRSFGNKLNHTSFNLVRFENLHAGLFEGRMKYFCELLYIIVWHRTFMCFQH